MNFDAFNGEIQGTRTCPHVRLTFNKIEKDFGEFVKCIDVSLDQTADYIWLMDTAQQDLPTLYTKIDQDVYISRQKR